MLVMFECTVVGQRLRNLRELRALSTPKQAVQVHRQGKWERLPGDALLPGDLISLGRPAGGAPAPRRRRPRHVAVSIAATSDCQQQWTAMARLAPAAGCGRAEQHCCMPCGAADALQRARGAGGPAYRCGSTGQRGSARRRQRPWCAGMLSGEAARSARPVPAHARRRRRPPPAAPGAGRALGRQPPDAGRGGAAQAAAQASAWCRRTRCCWREPASWRRPC